MRCLRFCNRNAATLFKTYSRRLVMWEQLAQQQQTGGTRIGQPALYLFDGVITSDSGTINYERTSLSVPFKRELARAIVIYAQIPGAYDTSGVDATTPGGDIFYPLIEAIESALELPYGEPQGALTLGGRVFHCWIEGRQYIFSGDIDPEGQGMAIVPIKIMLP